MSEQPTGEILLYQRDGAPALEVRLDADTVWLSQQQIADLFQTSRTNVVEHVRNVYDEGELDEAATCRKFRQVRTEGTRQVSRELPFYNLDRLITAMEAPTLKRAGTVSHQQAVAKAEGEYEKYRAQLDAAPSDIEAAYLESVKRAQREIEGR